MSDPFSALWQFENREKMSKECPKCKAHSGDNWTQCDGRCPMIGSPHYKEECRREFVESLCDCGQTAGQHLANCAASREPGSATALYELNHPAEFLDPLT